jgi:hypothetical protein
MKITTEQLQTAITAYFEQEIAQKAVGFKKFVSYFIMASYEDKIPGIINELKSDKAVQMLNVIDENGNIDVDKLYNYSKTAIRKSGQFVLFGIIFNENDIDKLYSIIERGGGYA